MERVGYCFRMVFWIGYVPTQVLDSLLIQEEVQGISQGTTVCLDLLPGPDFDQPGW